jgi:hypothetical protein
MYTNFRTRRMWDDVLFVISRTTSRDNVNLVHVQIS